MGIIKVGNTVHYFAFLDVQNMTLIAAIKGKDGIVMVSDSRGLLTNIYGEVHKNDDMQKIYKLSDDCIIAITGDFYEARQLVEDFRKYNNITDPEGVAKEFGKYCETVYNGWYSCKIDPKEKARVHMIVAGYKDSIPQIYRLSSDHNFIPFNENSSNFAVTGEFQHVNYMLNLLYDGSMSIVVLKRLAVFLIMEASHWSIRVQPPIQIAIIDNGGVTFSDAQEITDIRDKNEQDIERIKQLLLQD